jgi:hypothetical protein
MNLTSCDRCGVVLDKDKLFFPEIYDHDSGELIETNAIWKRRDFVSKIDCPVCDAPIPEH